MTGVALGGGGTTEGGTLPHDGVNRSSRISRFNRGRLDEGRLLVLSTFRHLGMSGVSQTFKTKGSRPHPSWMRLHILAANQRRSTRGRCPMVLRGKYRSRKGTSNLRVLARRELRAEFHLLNENAPCYHGASTCEFHFAYVKRRCG